MSGSSQGDRIVTADKIVLDLTDEMDDTLFDFPLTVKVCAR